MNAALRIALLVCACLALPAMAQTGPNTEEAARYTGLHAAAHAGDASRILALAATAPAASLNTRDGNGRTPLHVATFARRPAAVRALAQAGADLALLDNDRYDGVTIAAVANDEDSLRTLLALGASAKLTTSRYDGTALIAAAHLGHVGVVQQLIKAGAPLDHVNNLHWTAMIESIVLGDGGARHQQVLRDLLAAGANTQLVDASGKTPLQLAQSRGYAAMVTMLQQAGAR